MPHYKFSLTSTFSDAFHHKLKDNALKKTDSIDLALSWSEGCSLIAWVQLHRTGYINHAMYIFMVSSQSLRKKLSSYKLEDVEGDKGASPLDMHQPNAREKERVGREWVCHEIADIRKRYAQHRLSISCTRLLFSHRLGLVSQTKTVRKQKTTFESAMHSTGLICLTANPFLA
jgi:hypothetical protein